MGNEFCQHNVSACKLFLSLCRICCVHVLYTELTCLVVIMQDCCLMYVRVINVTLMESIQTLILCCHKCCRVFCGQFCRRGMPSQFVLVGVIFIFVARLYVQIDVDFLLNLTFTPSHVLSGLTLLLSTPPYFTPPYFTPHHTLLPTILYYTTYHCTARSLTALHCT